MLGTYLSLKKKGVMGLNERNLKFVAPHNPRRLLINVDNKLVTKELAAKADIPVPALIGSISNGLEMRGLEMLIEREEGFVIKPAMGSQGNGIVVVDSKLRGGWRLGNGRRITLDEIRFHINNIISGMYSLGGQPDQAMFEYLVQFDPVFEDVSFKGVPDIRVIVLKGIPVSAMVRLPTAESDGKANLHKGGVGVGVNLVQGTTTEAMQGNQPIPFHPDTGQPLSGIKVPHWDRILEIAAKSYDMCNLGYIGVDVVLDKDLGPLLLELNARPGIAIQIANRSGLKPQLEAVEKAAEKATSLADRIAIAKSLYQTYIT